MIFNVAPAAVVVLGAVSIGGQFGVPKGMQKFHEKFLGENTIIWREKKEVIKKYNYFSGKTVVIIYIDLFDHKFGPGLKYYRNNLLGYLLKLEPKTIRNTEQYSAI